MVRLWGEGPLFVTFNATSPAGIGLLSRAIRKSASVTVPTGLDKIAEVDPASWADAVLPRQVNPIATTPNSTAIIETMIATTENPSAVSRSIISTSLHDTDIPRRPSCAAKGSNREGPLAGIGRTCSRRATAAG